MDAVTVLQHALNLLREGVLSIDDEGRIWRHFELTRYGRRPVSARRAENRTRKGYLTVTLGMPKTRITRCVLAHVLIWNWLRGGIPNGLQINHKDLNKSNNCPSNLEVVTQSANIIHSYANGRTRPWANATEWRPGRPRLSDETKAEVMHLRVQGLGSHRISKLTGISRTHVERILKGGRVGCSS